MELSSAERYNPHTNSWSPIVAMTSRRSGVINYLNIFIHKLINISITGGFSCCQRCSLRSWRI